MSSPSRVLRHTWSLSSHDIAAALTMYQYAERVRNLTARSPADYRSHLLLRSRSLLTASNSLSLVDAKNAWFTTIASSKPGTDERVSDRLPRGPQHGLIRLSFT